MQKVIRQWALVAGCVFAATGYLSAQGVSFSTQASSTRVGIQEPFRIVFSIDGASQASAFQPPAFTGFQVLSQSQSQSTSIDNGKMSQSISIIYILQGTSEGRFTIAGATARVNGNKMQSNPVTITVTKAVAGNQPQASPAQPPAQAAPNPFGFAQQHPEIQSQPGILHNGENAMDKIKKNVFVRVDVDKRDVYVGQQVTATYKLYTRLPTSSQVTKMPSFTGFSAHDIPQPNPPQPTLEKVNGETFKVFTIRKVMLFPLQSGDLSVDPAAVDNTVRLYQIQRRKSGGDPFGDAFSDAFKDPFGGDPFNDPFFQDAFGGSDVTYHDYDYPTSSQPLTVHVKALPDEGKPAGFNGAVGAFRIAASLDKSHFSTDDAATLTVTVSGHGNITLLDAPKIDFPTDFDSYDPKITDKTSNSNPFGGSRTFTYVIMAKTPGQFTIPPVQFSYFDPGEKKYETVSSAAFPVTVSQGRNQQPGTATYAASGDQLQPIRTGKLAWTRTRTSGFGAWWYWLALLIPLGALGAMIATKRRKDSLQADQALLKHKRASRVALKRLSQANQYLTKNESKAFYGEVSQAVWGYLCDKLGIPFAELSKQKAQDKLAERQVNGNTPTRLFGLLDHCEMALYAGYSGHEQMQETYKDALSVLTDLEQQLKK